MKPQPHTIRSFRRSGNGSQHLSRSTATSLALALTLAATGAHAAGTFYVNAADANANDAGPGTQATPYRTIDAAQRARGGPGTTILVSPGVYAEQVTVDTSGTAAQPYVIKAIAPGVILDGADDFGVAAKWSQVAGGAWLAASVTWTPKQVFVGGVGLTETTSDPVSMPAGTFRYVTGQGLYVKSAGNPGSSAAKVGRRAHGFRVPSQSYLTIEGFRITHTEDYGIYLLGGCSSVAVRRDTVTYANRHGINVVGGTALTIEQCVVGNSHDHGINLAGGVTQSTVQDNESYRNTRISPRAPAANGMMIAGSSNNVIQRNRFHDNEDTGFDVTNGSNGNLSVQNLSWNNGDHGFNHLGSTGTRHIGDVAYGNYDDGFSIQGGSTGTQIWNSIAANNGIASGRFDVYVDTTSTTSFRSDYNIVWNSTAAKPVKYDGIQYLTLAALEAASGQEAESFQSDPRFVNPSAGDFHLQSGSQAIDSGNSSMPGWPVKDFEGKARVNDALAANTGVGAVTYADRGAFEFVRNGSVAVTDFVAGPVALGPAFPNPGRGPVAFSLELARPGAVSWSVTDVAGRVVWREARSLAAGRTEMRWSGVSAAGRKVPSGMYVIRLDSNGETLTRSFAVVH